MVGPLTDYHDDVFVSSVHVYRRNTSIRHKQLRDLISAGDNEDEFYCVADTQVHIFNAAKRVNKVMMNLGFQPTCMTCRNGYLAAGGQRSELEVRQLRTGRMCFKGTVGGDVNNALHVGKAPNGEMRMFVCNNDETVKVYALPSMTPLTTIRCHVPINYAALSPDGRKLICVGDCPDTLLYDATPTGYSLSHTLTEASDPHGMCCGWSHSGRLFGSTYEDGTAAMWDSGSGKLVARYKLPSAARTIKFSPRAPMDLVAVAEDEDAVWLIDVRKWDAVQVVAPLAARGGDEGDISGIAWSPSGLRLWMGLKEQCAMVVLDDRKRRTFGSFQVK